MKTAVRPEDKSASLIQEAPYGRMPVWFEPMKATLTEERFSRAGWWYEPKLDGVRCLAFLQKGKVKLLSRNQLPMNETYPEVVESLQDQLIDTAILDGEIVAFRPGTTVTSFEVLQQRLGVHDADEARRSPVRVYFYAFDMIYAQGRDLRELALEKRKNALHSLLHFGRILRYTGHVAEKGEAFYAEACRQGWEGLIAKRKDSRYRPGRSREWLKFKCVQEQEFVIGGYSNPQGSREHFGALLLGYYDDQGDFRFAGKVGTGFTGPLLNQLMALFKKNEQKQMPFKSIDISRTGLHWVKPIWVAQIGFAEWTHDGKLRQPRFIGLRTDKKPSEVTREKPVLIGGSHGK